MSEQRKKRPNSGLRNRSGSGEIFQKQNHRGKTSTQNHSQKNNFQRQPSLDAVRKKVQEEGRTARNLLTWSVPLENEGQRKASRSPHSTNNKSVRPRSTSSSKKSTTLRDRTNSPAVKKSGEDRGSTGSAPGTPTQRRVPNSKKDLRARYWAFLFDNLRRAVDEIYVTCETDESVVECKEAIMMLEQSVRDFKGLIERLKLLRAYENADESNRPHSLAWEVRKTSPGKGLSQSQGKDFIPSPTVSRSLNFAGALPVEKPTRGNSWADRVRNSPPVVTGANISLPATVCSQKNDEAQTKPDKKPASPTEDQEGWATVQKGRHGKIKRAHSGNLPTRGDFKSPAQSKSGGRVSRQTLQKQRSLGGTPNSRKTPKLKAPLISDVKSPQDQNSVQERKNRSYSLPNSPPACVVGSDNLLVSVKVNPWTQGKNKDNSGSHSNIPDSIREKTDSSDSEKENKCCTDAVTSGHSTDCIPHENATKVNDSAEKTAISDLISTSDKEYKLKSLSEGSLLRVTGDGYYSNQLKQALQEKGEEEYVEDDEDDDEDLTGLKIALATVLDQEQSLDEELEKENDAALEQAREEEMGYLQELAMEQNREIDVETETETETESELGNTVGSSTLDSSADLSSCQGNMDWDSFMLEHDGKGKSKQSWADMAEEEEVAIRTPGRSVHMHEKLSSPSRKRSIKESQRRHEEKQAKAYELREKLMAERTERIKSLINKVEEIRQYKGELMQTKRVLSERKLEQAEQKRQIMLQSKVRKAHEEETKANEIAFINTLEAQNKLHDIKVKHKESQARLLDRQEERLRKKEEEEARKLAVDERRKALEDERQAKLREIHDRRTQREKIVGQRQQEREKERQEVKRAREKDREERLSLLNEMHQQRTEDLQRKIKQKQTDSEQRHKERLEQIREKAFEMSILRHSSEDHNEAPLITPYDKKKFCAACNVMISSEVYLLSHLRGKKHQIAVRDSTVGKDPTKKEIESFNLKYILNAPGDKPDPQTAVNRERQKSLKKRCKKLRQRMAQRGSEYETALSGKQQTVESDNRAKLQKVVKDLNKYIGSQDKGPWPQSKVSALDRGLGEIARVLERKIPSDQAALRLCGGLTCLNKILLVIMESRTDLPPIVPVKSLVLTCNVFRLACRGCYDNCHYMLFGNKIGSVVDLLIHQLNMLIPENFSSILANVLTNGSESGTPTLKLPCDPVASALVHLLSTVTSCLAKNNPAANSSEASAERMSTIGEDSFSSRAHDVISYIISVGVVDRLSTYFDNVRGPLDKDPQAADFILHGLGLLTGLTRLLSKSCTGDAVFGNSTKDSIKSDDSTHLIGTFKVTDLCGIVSLIYGMLLHSGAPTRDNNTPPELPAVTTSILTTGFKMLNHLATLDLELVQSCLGSEGMSLEFRHIASYLLWSCNSAVSCEELLHEVILCVGYFTILHPDNQSVIQSGQPPTVLQQMCQLPFQYFSDPRLTTVLFPTLIACCYQCEVNTGILQQELSSALLSNFIEEKVLEAQHMNLLSPGPKKSKTSSTNTEKDGDTRMTMCSRISQDQWAGMQAYFTAN